MAFAVVIFFNQGRTDYLVRGPYKNRGAANRAALRYRSIFHAAHVVEPAEMAVSETDLEDSEK